MDAVSGIMVEGHCQGQTQVGIFLLDSQQGPPPSCIIMCLAPLGSNHAAWAPINTCTDI